jgi:small-conductance mechanosensitive channel
MEEQLISFLKNNKHFLIVIFAVVILRYLFVLIYKRRKKLRKKDKFIIGINNVSLIVIGVWLFILILHMLGITIKEFFTSITIIAAALAIVFREYIQNGLNGMIIMFGDNFQIGDYIMVNNEKGYIHDLTLLHMHLKNDEDNLVLIPNNVIALSTVINYTKNPRHYSSIDFELRSAQSIQFEQLEAGLGAVLVDYMDDIRQDSIKLKVVEFKEDLVYYRFRFGMKKYDHDKVKVLKQLLYRNLLQILHENKKSKL